MTSMPDTFVIVQGFFKIPCGCFCFVVVFCYDVYIKTATATAVEATEIAVALAGMSSFTTLFSVIFYADFM